jgi:hypothetical protein
MILDLTKVLGTKQLLSADDFRALLHRAFSESALSPQIFGGIFAARHLREAYFDGR